MVRFVIRSTLGVLCDSFLAVLFASLYSYADVISMHGIQHPVYGVDYVFVDIHNPFVLGARYGVWFGFVVLLLANRYLDSEKGVKRVSSRAI